MDALTERGETIDPVPASEWSSKARSGSRWIVVAFGLGQLVRLGTNITLAALLFEEAFALMAVVSAVMMGFAMFSDIGLQQNVIQSSRGDEPAFLNTAWTLQVIRGLLLGALAALMAWPLASFYGSNDPIAHELKWLIPIVALTALFDGLKSPAVLTAARHLQVANLIRIEVGVTVLNTLIILTLAWYTRSVYALAISAAVSAAVHTASTYIFLSSSRPRFTLESAALRSIFSFGKWIFLSTVLYFLAMQLDRLTFAAVYPLAEVGVYSIAAGLAMMVPTVVGKLQSAVVFPYYSRLLDQGMALPEAFKKAKEPILVALTYVVVLLITGAESFFSLAYDERYANAASFLQVLSLGVWFSSLAGLYGTAFLAKGLSRWLAIASAVKVGAFVLLFATLSLFESTLFMGLVVVLASEVIAAAVSRLFGYRLGLKEFKSELLLLLGLVALSAACLGALKHLPLVAGSPPLIRLAFLMLFVTAAFAPFLWRSFFPIAKPNHA